MDNIRYTKGLRNLEKIDGTADKKVINSLKDISPETGQFIIEFAFGDIYERKTLNLKQREMITLSSLVTQGDTHNQLIVHINGALNVGLTPNEIIEIFVQCIPYVGFPKVLNAINTAKEVLNSKK